MSVFQWRLDVFSQKDIYLYLGFFFENRKKLGLTPGQNDDPGVKDDPYYWPGDPMTHVWPQCQIYTATSNLTSLYDIRLFALSALPGHHVQTWRHPQQWKYITYRNAPEEDRATAVSIACAENLEVWMCGSRDTVVGKRTGRFSHVYIINTNYLLCWKYLFNW